MRDHDVTGQHSFREGLAKYWSKKDIIPINLFKKVLFLFEW